MQNIKELLDEVFNGDEAAYKRYLLERQLSPHPPVLIAEPVVGRRTRTVNASLRQEIDKLRKSIADLEVENAKLKAADIRQREELAKVEALNISLMAKLNIGNQPDEQQPKNTNSNQSVRVSPDKLTPPATTVGLWRSSATPQNNKRPPTTQADTNDESAVEQQAAAAAEEDATKSANNSSKRPRPATQGGS